MNAVQRIRRLGFRKWYERELMRSHAHLVLLLLAGVALVGSFEAFRRDSPMFDQALIAVCAAASAAIAWMAQRRYLHLLHHAEFVADQAVCRQCQAYGRWDPIDDDAAGVRLVAHCRGCGHEWKITLQPLAE